MRQEIYTFRVGEAACTALCDGTLAYPVAIVTQGLSEEEQAHLTSQYDAAGGHVKIPYTALLVETARERILLDTGAGPLGPDTGRLPSLLESRWIAAESIAVVILTHGHPDHIGGVTDASGQPRFPNARYIMGAGEWRFWTDEATLEKCARKELYGLGLFDQLIGEGARKYLPPLASRLELVESEVEISPGMRVAPAPGHTPGHLAVIIASGREQCLFVGDALVLPLQAERPEWNLPFDLSPDQATATRRAWFDRAASEEMLVFAYHCPFPPLGRIEPRGAAWHWVGGAGVNHGFSRIAAKDETRLG
ncbi:MAG: MBL fold metallo-hydrolase [Bryobacteraceae bacterium]|jgi:glyoxylase-like metal-dependent hydrolase (beta-lactamase superfamily II)